MPELPEVETVKRQLEGRLTARRFAQVEQAEPFMLRDSTLEDLLDELPGLRVDAVARRGKFIILDLTDGFSLTVHLGMTGQLLLVDDTSLPKYARFVFALEGGRTRLVFADMRKFGRLHLTPGGPPARVETLGADAWQGEWDAADLARLLEGRTAPLKAFLLDQRRLAGIGNIYADEILWGAGLSPLRPAGSLDAGEVARLAAQIRERLSEGVRLRGCSISDFVDTAGTSGGFQRVLRAYGRQGRRCARCGGTLARAVVAGRGTAYCPGCQR